MSSRTTPHEDNSPPDKNKAQPLPSRTTIPRTIPHQGPVAQKFRKNQTQVKIKRKIKRNLRSIINRVAQNN